MIKKIILILSMFCIFGSIANQTIDFTIALKQNNVDILKKKLLDISDISSVNYGKYMEVNDIMNIISPKKESADHVMEWLIANNINKNEIINYGDSIVCSTNINNVENLFNVKIVPYKLDNKTFYYAINDYIIPNHLQNIIEFVEGITKKFDRQKIKRSINNNIGVDPGYVAKEVVERLYSIDSNIKIYNVSAGSIEYQGSYGFDQDDLLISQKQNNEIKKKVSEKHIIGNNSYPDTESQLDMQMISQTANNIDLWFWGNPDWLYSFAVNFFNSKNVPDVISMSWGWAEDQQCTIANCTNITSTKYINRVNVEYIKIGLRGITITVSSGDAGAPGRTSETCDVTRPLNPVFPGSSPWITSIGATFVVNDTEPKMKFKSELCINNTCAKGKSEYPINFNYTGWTAGGGFSIYQSEVMPKWQQKLVNNYLKSGVNLPSKFNINGRAYPDISVVGHNCPVFSNGEIEGVDGTSCSSPIFAGIVSILNQHQINNGKPKLGYLNPLLYKMAENDISVFNDQVNGNNWCTEQTCCPSHKNGSDFGFSSYKGYDPVTGLGTPNVKKIINWLDKYT